MSIVAPPDIDVCDGVDVDDNNNRKCHLISENGTPFCGITLPRRRGVHPTIPLRDPCNTCGLPRCPDCVQLFLLERLRGF
jgi:hypothetical protein